MTRLEGALAGEIRKVVVDTYAIIADLTGQAPSGVTEVLEK